MTMHPTILLLEDEPLILIDLEFAAEDRGCNVLAATDIAKAMVHIQNSQRIDVAVLDVDLGGGTTCEPIAHKLDDMGVPYLLHSGNLNRKDETVQELGVRHIPKPADSSFVIEAALDTIDN